MFSLLTRWMKQAQSRPSRRPQTTQRTTQLNLESLEDRLTPSVSFYSSPPAYTYNLCGNLGATTGRGYGTSINAGNYGIGISMNGGFINTPNYTFSSLNVTRNFTQQLVQTPYNSVSYTTSYSPSGSIYGAYNYTYNYNVCPSPQNVYRAIQYVAQPAMYGISAVAAWPVVNYISQNVGSFVSAMGYY